MITEEMLLNWFTYHKPGPDDQPKYEAIRNKALELAQVIIENTVPCADQSTALRKVRESVFTANAAIARGGK